MGREDLERSREREGERRTKSLKWRDRYAEDKQEEKEEEEATCCLWGLAVKPL